MYVSVYLWYVVCRAGLRVGRSSVRGSAELVLLIMNSCTQHTFIDEIEKEGDEEEEEISE